MLGAEPWTGSKSEVRAGVDVGGGGEAESAGELRGEVADDVAEEIVGDDDVELARVADEFHGEGVDEEVAGVDVGIFGADGFEDALPEVAGVGHGVGFVGHAEAERLGSGACRLEAGATCGVLAGVVEGVTDDALDAFAGVHVFLGGDFVGSSFLEEAAHADVEAFGVFAEDDELDVVGGDVAERGVARVEKFGGAGVDEEIEFEAKAEEDVGGVLVGGDAWIAEGAEEDGVEFVAQHFDGAGRKSDIFAEKFVGAPVEVDEFEGAIVFGRGGLNGFDGDGRDFLADAVAGNDGDAGVGTAVAEGDVGHVCGSGGMVKGYVSTGGGRLSVIGNQ